MHTLLDSRKLPFWAYIVIIAVGSILVLAIAAAIAVCFLRKARARRCSFDSEAGVDKRMTLRRGRLVQSADYMSLTGSGFGAGHFLNVEELEKASMKTRSRSPFEWWRNMNDKSSLRHSLASETQVSSVADNHETPTKTGIYERKDLTVSTLNLAPEAEKDRAITTKEISPPASPIEKPTTTTNFSRSFSTRGQNPLIQHNKTLSRIEEASPHTSMLSSTSIRGRSSNLSAFMMDNNRSSQMFEIRRQNASPHAPSDLSRSNSDSEQSAVTPPAPALPEIPASALQRASRVSFTEDQARRSHSQSSRRTSMASRRESIKTTSSRRASKIPLPESPDSPKEYWETRTDLVQIPRRTSSRTGSRKVLRKKSLRQSEMWLPT